MGDGAPHPLASRSEVAKFLGLPSATLDQWARSGRGPSYRRIGRHVRYRWSDVEAWVASQPSVNGGDAA